MRADRIPDKIILLIAILLLYSHPSSASDSSSDSNGSIISKQNKALLTNLAGVVFITGWGILNWDYFKKSPCSGSEGWFSQNTKEGGADKTGHFQTSYSLSHIFAGTYEKWGYSHKKAALLGSLSSFGLMGWIELGDSFSDYGFAYEDFIMNCVGTVTGYLTYIYPQLSKKIDFRVEYVPDFTTADIFTDYERTKYIMAVKLDGFDSITNKHLKYLEFHLGYYARGYEDNEKDKSRNIYAGLAFNLSKVFENFSMKKTAKFFTYNQLPYTYIAKN